jgi:ElaB/YqjD/DUF883 family membrane-anchored ribosome-binding protein
VNKIPAIQQLEENANSLITSAKDLVETGLEEAGRRASSTLHHGEKIVDQVLERASESAGSINRAAHNRPYHLLVIGFAIGALLVILTKGTCRRSR